MGNKLHNEKNEVIRFGKMKGFGRVVEVVPNEKCFSFALRFVCGFSCAAVVLKGNK